MQNEKIEFNEKNRIKVRTMAEKIANPTVEEIKDSRETKLEYKKLRMKCLEMAVSLRVSGDPELIESKADHFFNWLIHGEKR